jgi:nicotinate-nucleotide--dimethylbenzimidazole phosphoribosyltransferase
VLPNFVIRPISSALQSSLQNKIDQKTKPLGSLGQLESLAVQIGLCLNSLNPSLDKPCIIVFAGDHGIVESGVSAYPQSVTAQMVANFLAGGAAISVFAKQHKLELVIVDAGVNAEMDNHLQLISAKIAKGTENFLNRPAMTNAQCIQAIQTGAATVEFRYVQGCNCIGFGEMGIGNSSSAALLMNKLADFALAQCVGRGTGLNDDQLQNKLTQLQKGLDRHPGISEPLDVLATFGGFEIAMMTGAYLKAAELGMLILVDGFIASTALLVASKLHPQVLEYCVFSHVSSEQGHRALLAHFNAKALLDLDLRLGEGSGIALAFPIIQSAIVFLNEMATFAEAGVDGR